MFRSVHRHDDMNGWISLNAFWASAHIIQFVWNCWWGQSVCWIRARLLIQIYSWSGSYRVKNIESYLKQEKKFFLEKFLIRVREHWVESQTFNVLCSEYSVWTDNNYWLNKWLWIIDEVKKITNFQSQWVLRWLEKLIEKVLFRSWTSLVTRIKRKQIFVTEVDKAKKKKTL